MRKLRLAALAFTLFGVAVSAGPTWAQDTTPPTITFTSPAEGATFTRCDLVMVSFTVVDTSSGLDTASVVLSATTPTGSTMTFPIPAASIGAGGMVDFQLSGLLVDLGVSTLTVTARDLAGNTGMATRTINLGASFACALELVAFLSEEGLFFCAGVDRTLFLVIQRAQALSGSARRAHLDVAIDCVTQRSRMRNRLGQFANFAPSALGQRFAVLLAQDLMALRGP